MLTSGHDTANAIMISQQLWQPAMHLGKTELDSLTIICELGRGSQGCIPPAEVLPSDGFWESRAYLMNQE